MAQEVEQSLDLAQVKKAVHALVAFTKKKGDGDSLLLNEHEKILLMVTVWKIPEHDQCIKIPLPCGIRPETAEVCLFTRDEPNMTAEQTEAFYKKLLQQQGIKHITQIIPYKTLKKEYKPFEAKRRLMGNYDLFLSDDRIRRLLPSHIGKHFYQAKKAPLSVNLKEKNLAQALNKVIQGTILPVTSKGCCYSALVGHTGMKIEEVVENVKAAVSVIGEKLSKKWKNVKILHLKTQSSLALTIYTSIISNMDDLDTLAALAVKKKTSIKKRKIKGQKETATKAKQLNSAESESVGTNDATTLNKANLKRKRKTKTSTTNERDDDDEEIPQLVPIANTKRLKSKGAQKRKIKHHKETTTKANQLISAESESVGTNDATTLNKANLKVKRKTKSSTINERNPDDEEIPQLVPIANTKSLKSKGAQGGKPKLNTAKKAEAEPNDKTSVSKKKNPAVQRTPTQKRKGGETVLEQSTPSKQKKKAKKLASKENVSSD
ncbi:ribosomal L1 domain-containing protein 1 [Ambystoma mexicanum]|uniref:ribosomal L1 domain-containing protein 1 n=1 Tax=Ambystoma mexicanum TaxID=8296 RepID=UPI0037E7B1D1